MEVKLISDERLSTLKEGLEGVTPGPWGWDGSEVGVTKKDASHIANCDPDTIRSLIHRLELAETTVDMLEEELQDLAEHCSI